MENDTNGIKIIEPDSESDQEEFSDAVEVPEASKVPSKDPTDEFFDVDWRDNKDDDESDDLMEKNDQDLNEASKSDQKEQELKARIVREGKLTQDEKTELKSQAVALKKSGNELYLSGANTEAIDKYNEALDTCPLDFKEDRAMLLSNKAAALIKLDEKEKAIEECSKAIELNPDYVKALTRRGQVYEDTDKPHEAFKDFEKVLQLDPGHKEARMAVMRLPDKIKEKDEKLKEEMLGTEFYRMSQQVLKIFKIGHIMRKNSSNFVYILASI